MAKKCIQCGHENDDSSLRCVCGRDLSEGPAAEPTAMTTAAPASQEPSPAAEPRLILRKVVFLVWAIGLAPLFVAVRSLMHVAPVFRSLISTGVFAATAVAALWLLGREKRPMLRAWRIFFMAWMLALTPLILVIVDGIAEQGWPQGRFNRSIARLLTLIIILTVPAVLTGLAALIRTYRVAAVLAIATGVDTLVLSYHLFRATAPIRISVLGFVDILDLVGIGSKVATYLSIPVGVALIVGGIMTFRAARTRRTPSRAIA
jgi:hypothetical protein